MFQTRGGLYDFSNWPQAIVDEHTSHMPNPSHRHESGFPMQNKNKCRIDIQRVVHIYLGIMSVLQGWCGGLLFWHAGANRPACRRPPLLLPLHPEFMPEQSEQPSLERCLRNPLDL